MKDFLLISVVLVASACTSAQAKKNPCPPARPIVQKTSDKKTEESDTPAKRDSTKFRINQKCCPKVENNRVISDFMIKGHIKVGEKVGFVDTIAFRTTAAIQLAKGWIRVDDVQVPVEARVSKDGTLLILDIPHEIQEARDFSLELHATPVFKFTSVLTTKGFVFSKDLSGEDKVTILQILSERTQRRLRRPPGMLRKKR